MRTLLVVSVALTVAVAWAAGAAPEGRERAAGVTPAWSDESAASSEALEPAAPAPPLVRVELSAGGGGWAATEADELGESWVPLELVVVDGETGARERARESSVLAESRPSEEWTWRSSTHVRRGDRVTVAATAMAAAGHVSDDGGSYRASGYVSRRAERVRMLAPLRREADVSLRVVDAAGRPVAGARVKEVNLGGAEPTVSRSGPVEEQLPEELEVTAEGEATPCSAAPTDAHGLTRVRGIPHLLDERFWIVAGVADHEGFTDLRLGALGSSRGAEIRLPEAPSWVAWTSQGIGLGGCGGSVNLRAGCRRHVPARLEVVVFRRDGSAAAGVTVALGLERLSTDERGRAVFEGLRPGTYDLDARDPDFVWSKTSVQLRDGESRIVEILESPGWTARVTLLDSMGRRVPFARVDVSSRAPVAYVRVEGGVQDLALYTDANGEVEVPRLHHAPVRLRFDYGSRHESVTIEEIDPYAVVRLPPPG